MGPDNARKINVTCVLSYTFDHKHKAYSVLTLSLYAKMFPDCYDKIFDVTVDNKAAAFTKAVSSKSNFGW